MNRAAGALAVTVVALLSPAAAIEQPAAMGAPRPQHLIYVHGRIVQVEQSARPFHAERGYYELERILQTFRERGYEVIGGIRPREATVSSAADDLVAQIRRLIAAGARPEEITVVGASMGASITLRASARLGDPAVRFALLGTCLAADMARVRDEEGKTPRGRVLAIREESDDTSTPCAAWNAASTGNGATAREIVIKTGQGHGFLYRPMPEWVEPLMEWAGAARRTSGGRDQKPADTNAPARAP